MIKCLLVDDESPAIDLLKNHISLFDELKVVGSCNSAMDAFTVLKTSNVDLMFLDIEMPILQGLEFLKSLKNPPKVIITTAYRDYALEGYDLDIVDYLLKPISFSRFIKSIDRYHERCKVREPAKDIPKDIKDHFFINANRKKVKIAFDEILFVESLKDYTRIQLIDHSIVVKGNLGSIYGLLPKERFLRVHRSFVVSIDKVTAFTKKDIEIGDKEIPIGSSYMKSIELG